MDLEVNVLPPTSILHDSLLRILLNDLRVVRAAAHGALMLPSRRFIQLEAVFINMISTERLGRLSAHVAPHPILERHEVRTKGVLVVADIQGRESIAVRHDKASLLDRFADWCIGYAGSTSSPVGSREFLSLGVIAPLVPELLVGKLIGLVGDGRVAPVERAEVHVEGIGQVLKTIIGCLGVDPCTRRLVVAIVDNDAGGIPGNATCGTIVTDPTTLLLVWPHDGE